MFSPAATAITRSERSAESTPAPSQQASNSSSLCGNIPVLLHQQGRDGRDGRDGLQGPVGPQGPTGLSGIKGEKGDRGIQLQGPPGLQGTLFLLLFMGSFIPMVLVIWLLLILSLR